jgi:hypothetical protein
MTRRLKISIGCFGLILFLNSYSLRAQIFQDKNTLSLIREDVDYIYNFDFDKARELTAEIVKLYPGHPIEYLINGMMIYWENYPLLPSAQARELFEADMHKCIKLSESHKEPEHEAEFLLANLCARGMLLMFYSDNDLVSEVIPMTVSSYKHVRKSFDFTSSSADFYYFTGLYNYYREAYPREYPVYKSVAMLFPRGSAQQGLTDLLNSAKNAVVLGPESYYLLTWVYTNFEYDYPSSIIYCKSLNDKYPENALYRATYIKNLLLLKEYDEAEKLINISTDGDGNKYLQAQLFIFNGLLQEKKYKNNELAEDYYNKGLNSISFAGEYGNEYAAYAYFGLSRINDSKGEKHTGKMYRTKAEKLVEFKKINFDK